MRLKSSDFSPNKGKLKRFYIRLLKKNDFFFINRKLSVSFEIYTRLVLYE